MGCDPQWGAKAVRGLRFAEMLIGPGKSKDYTDAAACRLYYAAYQAARGRALTLEESKREALRVGRQGTKDFPHATVGSNAVLLRGDPTDRKLFEDLETLREQADYAPIPVDGVRLGKALPRAKAFIEAMTK